MQYNISHISRHSHKFQQNCFRTVESTRDRPTILYPLSAFCIVGSGPLSHTKPTPPVALVANRCFNLGVLPHLCLLLHFILGFSSLSKYPLSHPWLLLLIVEFWPRLLVSAVAWLPKSGLCSIDLTPLSETASELFLPFPAIGLCCVTTLGLVKRLPNREVSWLGVCLIEKCSKVIPHPRVEKRLPQLRLPGLGFSVDCWLPWG
jgi:hypothetical protein